MNYKTFPKRELCNKENWHKLAIMDREDVVNIYNNWIETDKENRENKDKEFAKRRIVLNEINEVLDKHKIPYKKYSKSNFLKCTGYIAWYDKNIHKAIFGNYSYYYGIPSVSVGTITTNNITYSINSSPTNLIELYDKVSKQHKSGKGKINANNKLFIESIKYATLNNIDIEGCGEKDIISIVDRYAKDRFIESEYPDGTSVYLKHVCRECDEWIVGERRCSCGNRRVGLEIDGDLLNGYQAYPEGY